MYHFPSFRTGGANGTAGALLGESGTPNGRVVRTRGVKVRLCRPMVLR